MKKILSLALLCLFSVNSFAYRIVNNSDFNMYVYLLNTDDHVWAEHEFYLYPGQTIENPMTSPETETLFFKITTAGNWPKYLWEGHYFGVWSEFVIDPVERNIVRLTIDGNPV